MLVVCKNAGAFKYTLGISQDCPVQNERFRSEGTFKTPKYNRILLIPVNINMVNENDSTASINIHTTDFNYS